MKRILPLLLFLFLGICAGAQKMSSSEKKAREMYMEARFLFDTKDKIRKIKEAIELDNKFIEAYWTLSDSYKEIKDEANYIYYLEKAERIIRTNKNLQRFLEKTLYRLGKAYLNTGQYEKAKKCFEEYPEKNKEWIKKCDTAIEIKKNPVPFKPVNLSNVNTQFDDYWPSITADGQNISTTVNVATNNNGIMVAQEDIYFSRLGADGQWGKSRPIGPPTNTDQNEGAQNFSVDGRYIFFVACNRSSGLGGCDIYYSIKKGDTWSEPKNPGSPLNSRHQETTPSFSPTGEELFFASNRPGSVGDLDIWVSQVTINDDATLSFGTPRNLGAPINTTSNEISPFIHVDNQTLYFSSEGHLGLGNNDVFYSKRDDNNKWSEPKNIGYPINTHRDEIGFSVNAQGKKAYLSSDGIQNNGRGKDIYEVDLPEHSRPKEMEFFKGKVIDAKTKKPLQARIEVFQLDDNKTVFQSISDEETGEFQAFLPTDKEYGYNINKKGYMFFSGSFVEKDSLTVAKNVDLSTIAVGEKIILHNIFFDFDKATLKPKSIAELERVAKFLKQNPKVSIELGGHTDAKGSAEYNQPLSENRAKAAVDYLVKLGIDADRMTYKGYGKSKPIATNETDAGRALNRRTEIIVTKIK
jgi:outer membrane protein OmpA-like peptidoglycan-associated protein